MLTFSKFINKIYHYSILFIFFWIFLNIILNHQDIMLYDNSIINPFILVFLCGLTILLFMYIYNKIIVRYIVSHYNFVIVILILFLLMLILQIISAYCLCLDLSKQQSDIGVIANTAQDFANHKMSDSIFFKHFPYNNMLMIVLSFAYRIGLIFSENISFNIPAIILNIISIDISIILMVIIIKNLLGYKLAVVGMMFSVLFTPYYLYSYYYYSDTLSMLYPILILFLMHKIFSSNNMSLKKYILYICAIGLALFIGIKIKATVLIVFIAFVLVAIGKLFSPEIRVKKDKLLKLLFAVLSPIIIVVICNNLFNYYLDVLHYKGVGFAWKQNDTKEIPISYWILMGLHKERYGAWNIDDAGTVVYGIQNYNERKKYTHDKIIERLQDYKASGYIKFLTKKLVYIWGDGTMFSSAKMNYPHIRDTFLHEIALYGSKNYNIFVYFPQTIWVVILFLIIIYIKNIIDIKERMIEKIILLTFVGIFIFSAIWESRSRYLMNYTPFFIILATYGFNILNRTIEKRFSMKFSKVK